MINNLLYSALRELGYSGSLPDMLVTFYRDNGVMHEHTWLLSHVTTNAALNDLKTAYLMSKGLSGSIGDMLMRAVQDSNYFTQPVGEWILSTGFWQDSDIWFDSSVWND